MDRFEEPAPLRDWRYFAQNHIPPHRYMLTSLTRDGRSMDHGWTHGCRKFRYETLSSNNNSLARSKEGEWGNGHFPHLVGGVFAEGERSHKGRRRSMPMSPKEGAQKGGREEGIYLYAHLSLCCDSSNGYLSP